MLTKFIFFAFIGTIGTLVQYSILLALVELYQFDPVIGSCWGALAGMLVNYSLNFKFNFKSSQPHQETAPKFLLIAVTGMGWNFLLMQSLTVHFYYLLAQIIVTVLVLGWNFSLNYCWTFNTNRLPASQSVWLQKLGYLDRSLWLLIVILLIRLSVSAFYPLYDPSESRYAEMARKMVESSQWIMPMIDYGVPFWGKPPLTIWLSALSLQIGGVDEFAVRLPSTLLGLGIVWIIYRMAKLQRDQATAGYAAVALASMVLFFVISGTVAMDQCMTFGITLAMAAFWRALKQDQRFWGYCFFAGLSIGLMAKGPITLVLTGLALGLWTALSGNWRPVWQRIPWISGTLLMLMVCVPWYLIAEQHSPGFLEYFFIGEHWKRFTEPGWTGDLYGVGREHHKGIIWLYWLVGAFPWSLALIYKLISASYRQQIRALFNSPDHWQLYCLLWMLAPVLFFSLSANLIWTYVLPGLPGLALLIGEWFKPSHRRLSLTALLVPAGFTAMVIVYQSPQSDFYKSQQRLVEAYRQHALPGEQLIYLKGRPDSAQFYLRGQSIQLKTLEALQDHLETTTHHFYVLKRADLNLLPDPVRSRLEPLKEYGKFILYQARSGE